MNLCVTCGLDFGSVSAFDAHRKGDYASVRSSTTPEGRYCLHESELAEAGWRKDNRGRWRQAITYDAILRIRKSR